MEDEFEALAGKHQKVRLAFRGCLCSSIYDRRGHPPVKASSIEPAQ